MKTFLWLCLCLMGFCTMTHGWGLTVQSWPWVLTNYGVGLFFAFIQDAAVWLKAQEK